MDLVLNRSGIISGGRIAEASVLTVATVMLIFALYWIFKPSPEGDEFRPYKYYDWLGTQASLQPNSIVRHSFEAEDGQLIEASISLRGVAGEPPLGQFQPSISVTITDPTGKVLLEQNDMQDAYGVLSIEQTGKHHIEIVNHQDRLFSISVSVYVIEKTPPLWHNFGLPLFFMSLPVITLAAWLFLVRTR